MTRTVKVLKTRCFDKFLSYKNGKTVLGNKYSFLGKVFIEFSNFFTFEKLHALKKISLSESENKGNI